ncbi:MAG: hypothetical protein Q8P20_10500 [bacterium]|nr:hypothetical protein [bacterium]
MPKKIVIVTLGPLASIQQISGIISLMYSNQKHFRCTKFEPEIGTMEFEDIHGGSFEIDEILNKEEKDKLRNEYLVGSIYTEEID